jgi:hypothetical protein
MARISTYGVDSNVTGLDRVIGSDWNTEYKTTKNFTVNGVGAYFNEAAIIDTGSFSWAYAPYSNTQPQAEKSFQQIDRVAQNINITGLAAEPLRVSALTLANTMPRTFIINEWVGQSILVHVPSAPSQYAIYNVIAVTPDTEWFFLIDLEFVSGISSNVLEGESLVFGFWSGANIVTSVEGIFPIIVTGDNDVVISLDTTVKNTWDTAYNRSLVSAAVTGTTTKTLTLNKQDGGTITASWVDQNTDAVISVFGRTGAIVAQAGDYTTTLVTEGTNLYFTDQRARNVISSSITGINYSNTTGIFSLASGFVIPTTTQATQWTTAYNDSITSAAVTGTTTKTLTLNQQDGGTITASWTDDNTNLITSVFGRTGAVVAQSGDYTTTLVTEGDNLYFTTARARTAISLTVTGTSGPATYSSSTGILNIPQYQGGVTSFNTRTGAITLTSTDVTDALGFTPENIANKSNDTALGTSSTLYPTQNAVKTYVDSATAGGIILQGDWNAATNVPDITGTTQTGFAWRVSVAGNTNLGGITDWLVNDLAVKSATGWIKIDNTESVTSVFGRFGTVVAQSGDYNTDLVTEGTTNLYFTTARSRESISAGTGITYNSTTGVISSSGGSVTSVGLSMPSAFTVTNSPVTSTGTLTVTGAGTTDQYIRGDGSLATLPGTSTEARSIIREVYNKTGATLTKGTVVYINSGQGNLPAVTKAIATGDMTSAQTFGIVQSDITDNNNGFVVVTGGLENLDTNGLGVGTQLYLSSTVAGAYTTVKQYAPAHLVYVAIVVRDHPTQGVIEVNIQNGYELDELHDVSARNPANNDIIAYNTTTSLWEKKSIATTLGYTPANAATTLTINGTGYDLSSNRTWSVGTVTSVGLALGTSGTDANISNSPITTTGEITLNLPTASATNRGLLSNGDWTTFNNKQTALNGTGFVKMSETTVSYITGTAAQILAADGSIITAGSGISINAGIISATGGGSTSARTEQVFTATAGQQVFTVTGGYVVGLIDVYVNGVKLIPSTDFTAGNGTSVTLTTGVVLADIVSIITYTANITVPSVSGSGTTNTIAKFVGASAIGDSAITDNGTTVALVGRALSGTTANFTGQLTLGSTITNGTFTYTLPSATGTLALASSLSGFLPLTGGTLTGALGGTSAAFSSSVTAGSGTSSGYATLNLIDSGTGSARYASIRKNYDSPFDLRIRASNSESAAPIVFDLSNAVEAMRITSAGNLLLGTTSSVYRLSVVGSGGINQPASFASSDTSLYIAYGANGTDVGYIGNGIGLVTGGVVGNFGVRAENNLFFAISNVERMRITSAGNVGIGTTSPFNPGGGGQTSLEMSGSSYSTIFLSANSATVRGQFTADNLNSWVEMGARTNHPLLFLTNNTERMRITSGGNVGIGTSVISQNFGGYTHLDIGNATNGGVLLFSNASGTNYGYINGASSGVNIRSVVGVTSFNNGGNESMRITSLGNVGIGTSNPLRRFVVEAAPGTFNEVGSFTNLANNASGDFGIVTRLGANALNTNSYHYIAVTGEADRFYIYGNGNVVNTNNSYGTLSDSRLKENISDATPKLADLLAVKIKNFNLIGEETKQIGVIAQELEEIFPSMVETDGKTGMKQVKTSIFIPMLIKAIQELSAKVTALENK